MDTIIKQAIFANGCFWCTEAVFQRLEGVVNVVSGYTGGHIKNPAMEKLFLKGLSLKKVKQHK